MKVIAVVLLVTVTLCTLCQTNATDILGIFAFGSKSHFNFNHAIMKSLHAAGHRITMVTPFLAAQKIENFTYVDSGDGRPVFVDQFTVDDAGTMTFGQNLDWLISQSVQCCDDVMKLPLIQKAMNSPEKLYDVLFVELLSEYSCYLPIAEKLGIPAIGTTTVPIWQHADLIAGAPNNPAAVPVLFGPYASTTQFFGRVKNVWKYFTMEYYHMKAQRGVAKIYREQRLPEHLLHRKEVSLVFYNSHPTLTSRPKSAKVIEIGGIHAVKTATKSLPKELQKFIDDAPHGVILFTMGSMIRSNSLKSLQRDAFIAAFASIPQRVIWKFEEPIENLPENVMILNWLPQSDILRHKNVIAFMSHCGLSGMYEAIATGTPVITIPLCADQETNAIILQNLGVAVDLRLETVTEKAVLTALSTIINDTRYYQRAQELSRAFQDRPMTPEESVVYWTNYVLRHNGAPHLKTMGSDTPFYQYFMLDIIGLTLLTLSSIVLLVYRITKRILFSPVLNGMKKSSRRKKEN